MEVLVLEEHLAWSDVGDAPKVGYTRVYPNCFVYYNGLHILGS